MIQLNCIGSMSGKYMWLHSKFQLAFIILTSGSMSFRDLRTDLYKQVSRLNINMFMYLI